MPELPEVETVRRQLHEKLAGARFKSIEVIRSGRERPLGNAFTLMLKEKTVLRIERRAKLLMWRLSDETTILAHLKMTGRFIFSSANVTPSKHASLKFIFQNRQGKQVDCFWEDMRKFGYMEVVTNAEADAKASEYGPEPLTTGAEQLAECFRGSKSRRIKSVLLDQARIAGVGNIYADEACHRAGILPSRQLGKLTQRDRVELARAVKSVLQESLDQRGTSAHNYVDTDGARGGFVSFLRVYGRGGKPCLTCKTQIKKTRQEQRGTHFCPTCQR